MDFAAWTRTLFDRGLRVVPPSHPAPVRLWALLPAGGLLHFRCHGTTVDLERYAEGDFLFAAPAGRCDCGCGQHLPAPQAPPRLVLRTGARPVDGVRHDGAGERGWRGYEAGLLSVDAAAEVFERLLAELTPGAGAAAGPPAGRGSAPVRAGGHRAPAVGHPV
ncbi:hypothetical protein [Actinopolymorpha rutila]|uniref:Uncharacterized protein n=1 Tax=Actinopolymorpha rutila TaxID=446787 RepID=A0A852ZCQ7_9ACTN|nr:hypothetical protein [Actinopolymorpha rutila]NYH90694.1 hypothetical protein [Actinopolymorpha rutila]